MTADHNGLPEDDDPFGYLYRPDGESGASGDGSEAPTRQQGVPRRSFAGTAQVGRTTYGASAPYGAAPYQQQAPGYQQQAPGYQQQPPAGPYGGQVPQQQAQQPPGGGHGRSAGRGSGRRGPGGGRGVMIGAAAVVAAIVIGIGIAVFNNNGDSHGNAGAGSSSSATTGQSNDTASPSAPANAPLPGVVDADTLVLSPGLTTNNDHAGAKSKDGKFVETMPAGSSVSWQVNVPKAGFYHLWVRYANAGKDSGLTVTVNGKANSKPIDLSNWSHSSDWAQAWYRSWAGVQLNSGQNTIVLSSGAGQGNVNLDQFALNTSGSPDGGWGW
ncbi:CBM35 domain-containing protein [Phaeacidiphilus oryzae]|uniref:CBM35 domain-containing protein n=1 Tax=Phaeacidiphilus oryzae TaxID=348818 RepID=UPI00056212DA|nr:CBM35 domain-containing protein [Phaeacidiphilus oryzae]